MYHVSSQLRTTALSQRTPTALLASTFGLLVRGFDSALLAMTFGLTICDIDSALLAMTSGLAFYVLYALSDDMWVAILEQPGCDRNDYLHRVANRKTMRAIQPVTNA